MEDKQLNFNQPLLSVRRGSSPTPPPELNKRKTDKSHPNLPPLPYYKSDLKSGPIRNPGVVPFQWERSPGRPKNGKKEQKETLEPLPLAPKLPPGRIMTHKVLNDSPASSLRSQVENNIPCSPETSSIDKAQSELDWSEEGKEDEDISGSGDESVTYEDARGTLSRTESFFLNCSVSGVDGLDGQSMEPSGVFSDPQTRDFMMGRFLPSAKAVASETPQFASRKYPVAREQSKPVKRVVTWNKRSPRYCDIPATSPHNIHRELEMEEEDDDVDEYDGIEDFSAKLCGLLPRSCPLNPIPGMRNHAQVLSSARSVHTRLAYAGVCSKSDNKDRIACKNVSTNESSSNAHFSHNGTTHSKIRSPQSFLGKETEFLGLPEEFRDFRVGKFDLHKKGYAKYKASLANHSTTEETTSPVNPAIEKTLYIDSEQKVEYQDSNSSSSESRGRNPSVDYSLQDIKALCDADEKAIFQSKSSVTSVTNLQKDQNVSCVVNIQQLQKPDVKDASQKSGPPLALAPPKSPSESWLSRTLPSMSKSYVGNLAFKPSPVDPKRERMMKTSNGQHMIFQPPGELATILEN